MPAAHPPGTSEFGFGLHGIEPALDPAWRLGGEKARAAFWAEAAKVGLLIRRRSLGKGLDKDGKPLAAISYRTKLARKRLGYSPMGRSFPNAPPLTPCYGLSRTRCLLRTTPMADGVWFDWGYDRHTRKNWGIILDYHRQGVHGKIRDVFGLPPDDRAAIKLKMDRWWQANRAKFAAEAAEASMKSGGSQSIAVPSLKGFHAATGPPPAKHAKKAVWIDVTNVEAHFDDMQPVGPDVVERKRYLFGTLPEAKKPKPFKPTPPAKPPAVSKIPAARPSAAAKPVQHAKAKSSGAGGGLPDNKALKNIKRAVEIFRAEEVGVDRAAHAELAKTHSRDRLDRIVMAYDRDLRIVQVNEMHDFWEKPAKRMRDQHERLIYASPSPDHLTWHEIGHAKHHAGQPDLYRTLGDLDRWATSAQQAIAARVSRRAAHSPLEFIAEVFAARKAGIAIDDAEVATLYNDLGGPP